MSSSTVTVTLWGKTSQIEGSQLQEMYHLQKVTVLAIKNGRIAEYNSKVVNTLATSQLFINPDIKEAKQLQSWIATNGLDILLPQSDFVGPSTILKQHTISSIIEDPSRTLQPLHCIVKATLVFIKTKTTCYPACPNEIGGKQCKKRVEQNVDGHRSCSKCLLTFPKCNYRYVLQVNIEDPIGGLWATTFDEAATKLVGMPAKDLYMLQFNHDSEHSVELVIKNLLYRQYHFTLSNHMETYNNETHFKSTIDDVTNFGFTDEINFLLKGISSLCLTSNA